MSTPFPGVDPFVEQASLWSVFQHHLVAVLSQMLLPALADRYRPRVGSRIYTREQVLFTSVETEEHIEAFLEIRHRKDSRLLTLIEVVSPTNKTTPEGRQAYEVRRQDARNRGASLLEIDLTLQGRPIISLPSAYVPTGLFTTVTTRSLHPDRPEIYAIGLEKPLPRLRVPLANDDRDAIVDLQVAVSKAYDSGEVAKHINYAEDPPLAWSDDVRQQVDAYLKKHGVRN